MIGPAPRVPRLVALALLAASIWACGGQPTPDTTSPDEQARATELLSQAQAKRQEGDLGIALE
jgi:hypothetical protein